MMAPSLGGSGTTYITHGKMGNWGGDDGAISGWIGNYQCPMENG